MTTDTQNPAPDHAVRKDKPKSKGAGAPKNKGAGAPDAWRDPWADWQPAWTARGKKDNAAPLGTGVHDRQETHSPTETSFLRISNARQKQAARRRILDARLWESLTPAEQDAAIDIALAFETMGRGLGFNATDWMRIPGAGGGNAAEAHSRLISLYTDWARRCHGEKTSHAMIIDILVFGHSCRAVDRDRRLRSGSARQNLSQGLKLYCRMRGWPDK